MHKEIRALAPDVAARSVRAVAPDALVRVVERTDLPSALRGGTLVVPDEELMRTVVAGCEPPAGTEVVWQRTFLRWDR